MQLKIQPLKENGSHFEIEVTAAAFPIGPFKGLI